MANLVGDKFDDFVEKQIDIRQTRLQESQREPATVLWENSKTAWVKVTSCVDVSKEKLKSLGLPENYSGNQLSKEAVLFNGLSKEGGQLRSGISTENSIFNNSAYGFGGNEFGFKPIPGITQTQVKHKNRGSLREATINIKVHNKKQLDIIETLYLRLGYTILIEWGWSHYFNNDNKLQHFNDSDSLSSYILNSTGIDQNKVLAEINSNKLKHSGNYDGMFGKVKNYSWDFNSDGTYNVTLNVISLGDIIESLKINGLYPELERNDKKEDDDDIIIANSGKNLMFQYLFKRKRQLDSQNTSLSPNYTRTVSTDYARDTWITHNKSNQTQFYKYTINHKSSQYFVQLGSLLRFIEKNLLIYNGDKSKPLINIDYNTTTNYCFAILGAISSDPRICAIKATFNKHQIFKQLDTFKAIQNGVLVGKLMNIYINFEHIIATFNNSVDSSTGKVVLFDFLKSLMDNVASSLGGINNFSVTVNETTNTLQIIDESPIPGSQALLGKKDEPTILGVYGTNSFVSTVNFKTELSNAFATTIAIGAQAQGISVGEDATHISRLNRGLTDRVIPTKVDSYQTQNEQTTIDDTQEKYKESLRQYSIFLKNLTGGEKGKDREWNEDDFSTYSSAIKDIIKYQVSKQNLKEQTSGVNGFIPLNLSVKMEGLSGVKIYQNFTIDNRILPSNYPDTLKFLVRTVDHSINGNTWETSLNSLSQPKVKSVITKQPETKVLEPSEDTPPESQVEDFRWPLALNVVRVTSYFGSRIHPITKKPQSHGGVDIAAPQGSTLFALADGVVVVAGNLDPNGAGKSIIIKYDTDEGSFRVSYFHCSDIRVTRGERVNKGQTVGYSGGEKGTVGAGSSTGPHLHLQMEALKNSRTQRGKKVNPLYYIKNKPSSFKRVNKVDY